MASTSWIMGVFSLLSKISLRGWNHSRRLFRFKPRKNVNASGENPGNILPSKEMLSRLAGVLNAIPGLKFTENVPLSSVTRFAIGGPARILTDASSEAALIAALDAVGDNPHALIGGGTNLVADDRGFPGVVLRYTANRIEIDGDIVGGVVRVAAGAVLQDLVDATLAAGLQGLHTMTGIPGWVGGPIYGNAGA